MDNVIPRYANIYSRDEIEATLEGIEGNRIIGDLDPELISMYVTLVNSDIQLEDIAHDMKRRFLERQTSQAIELLDGEVSIGDFYQRMAQGGLYDNEEEAIDMLRRVARSERIRATFWYDVRENFNVWNEWLAIRRGFRVVSLGKKWEAKL